MRTSVLVSSLLFGLWHVTSSLGLASGNDAVAEAGGSGAAGQVLGVVASVVATTLAGVVLCWFRLRSGSLVAPVLVHWAVNGAAVLASAAVWALTT
jgi:tRNA pseudouridine32 synthase/23S rRNA pseudouridine746 synthase